jgi:hypothetical protein
VTTPAAYRRVSWERSRFRSPTPAQTRALVRRSGEAGIEVPRVRTKAQASDALTRLENLLRTPTLGPM